MNQISWTFPLLFTLLSSSAFAHGRDSQREEPKKPEKVVERVKPLRAEAIDQLTIDKLAPGPKFRAELRSVSLR